MTTAPQALLQTHRSICAPIARAALNLLLLVDRECCCHHRLPFSHLLAYRHKRVGTSPVVADPVIRVSAAHLWSQFVDSAIFTIKVSARVSIPFPFRIKNLPLLLHVIFEKHHIRDHLSVRMLHARNFVRSKWEIEDTAAMPGTSGAIAHGSFLPSTPRRIRSNVRL